MLLFKIGLNFRSALQGFFSWDRNATFLSMLSFSLRYKQHFQTHAQENTLKESYSFLKSFVVKFANISNMMALEICWVLLVLLCLYNGLFCLWSSVDSDKSD